jgi:hypothetical protein
MGLDGSGDRLERDVADKMTIGVIHRLEMIDVYQRDRHRTACPHRAGDLCLGLGLPGRRIEQTCLGVHPGLGEQVLVHHETTGKQYGRDAEDGEKRVGADRHGHQDAEVYLGEVPLQRIVVQRQRAQCRRGIGELNRADDEHVVNQPASQFTEADHHGPGQHVPTRPQRAAPDRRGKAVEEQRRHAVGQADRARGEHTAVDDAPVHRTLREPEQRGWRHHRVDRR